MGAGASAVPPSCAPPEGLGPGFSHTWHTARDGTKLYIAEWDGVTGSERALPRAVVVVGHSFGAHAHAAGMQAQLLLPLAQAGFAVVAYDKRGHGRTGVAAGRFGLIGSGAERLGDLGEVIAHASEQHPRWGRQGTAPARDLPVVLLGHGMGGDEVLAFLGGPPAAVSGGGAWPRPEAAAVSGVVLLAPSLDTAGSAALCTLLHLTASLAPGGLAAPAAQLRRERKEAKQLRKKQKQQQQQQQQQQQTAGAADGSGADLHAMLLEVRSALEASAGAELVGAAATLTARQFGAALTDQLRLRLPRAQLAAAAEAFEAAGGADAEAGAASVDLDEFMRSVRSAGAPDAFCLRGVPAPTLAELSAYFRFLRADAVLPQRLSLPLLWLHGAADALSKLRPVESFFAQVGAADKQLVPLDELRHGVFGDADAPRACADALAWVEALCAKLPAPAPAQEDEGGSEEDDAEAEFPQAPATMVPVPRPLAASESEKQRVV